MSQVASNVTPSQTYYNFTCANEYVGLCHITLWIYGLFWIWAGIGTIGNCLIMMVLPRKAMRKQSTTVYLICLTISDLVTLWLLVIHRTSRAFHNVDLYEQSEMLCKTLEWFFYVFGGFSVWLLVLITMDRFLFTTLPHSSRRILSSRNATIASVLTFVFLSLVNIHVLHGFTWLGDQVDSRGINCGFTSESYEIFFMETYNVLILFGYSVLPIVLITAGNITIAARLREQTRRVQRSNTATRAASRNNSTTKMLIVVNIVFVVTTLPYCIFTLIKYIYVDSFINNRRVFQFVKSVADILLLSNFTFNFFSILCPWVTF